MTRIIITPLLLLFLTSLSCRNTGTESALKPAQFPLNVPEEKSLMTRWEKKPVIQSTVVDDMEAGKNWTATGIGEMSFTQERATDGKQSLRFRTSLRDEEHYRKNRTEWGSFGGLQGGNASVVRKFDKPLDWSDYNRLSFWVYVHPTTMRTYCLHLGIENEGTVHNATSPGKAHFIQDLKPGAWNHVMFEIPHLRRDSVTEIRINQMLTGHMPEDEGIVTYDIDQIEIQKVDADQYEGWNVSPGKFALSQAGYRPGDVKTALVAAGSAKEYRLVDTNGKTVFSGACTEQTTTNGTFSLLDFSSFNKPGVYRIICGELESVPFPIGSDIWLDPVYKAINFFFCERCGFDVPGVHRECHKDWQGFRGDDKKIINGGWHDAGDLSQGSWRTSMAVYSMMLNYENLENRKEYKELADRIKDEMEWGLEWLLKTRFGNGYHMSFSVMRIYTDNQVGTIDDVVSPASNVPWENFLTAAVQCKAAMLLEKENHQLAEEARIAAIEDWQNAFDSRPEWDRADYREASWGATSSVLLEEMTGEEKFRDAAIQFGKLIVGCQQQSFQDSIPITGYFYENTDRQKVIHNYHAAFEEAPLIALSMLCRAYPESDDWMKWYSAAVLHSEYFMKRGSRIAAPYDLLPNSVWNKPEINAIKETNVREDMLRQFNDGTPLRNDYVLRTFPIYHDDLFHGNTNIHMSGTWALAEASRLRGDSAGMRLVAKQLRWIFGANPFGQSLMYGEGYDFAPHFAYCLKDVVGSLPVGMDCMSGDMPHWSATNTATSKEIWVEPVNRFLGAVAVYTSEENKKHDNTVSPVIISTESTEYQDSTIKVTLRVSGQGKHKITVKTFNAETSWEPASIDLGQGHTEKIVTDLKITDKMMPCVAVFMADNDPETLKEITGSAITSDL